MKHYIILAAALAAAPAVAQDRQPIVNAPVRIIETQRLAAARAAVQYVWPLGTYERMMKGSFDQMTDSMMASMFDMSLGDIAGGMGEDGKPLDPDTAATTLREGMAKADPHFQERLSIMNRVMAAELVPVMNRLEPAIREAMARAYARKFTLEQLGEMNRFFATPAGGVYARESMMMWVDPEIMTAVAGFAPEMMKEMPRIMKKVEAASAHLPPPAGRPAD